MGILMATLASFGIGLGNVFLKKSYASFSPAVSFFVFAVFSVIFWATLGLAMGVKFDHTIDGFGVGFISAVFGQLVYIYMFYLKVNSVLQLHY